VSARNRLPVVGVAIVLGFGAVACSGSKHTASCAGVIRANAPVTDRGSRAASGSVLTVDAANAGFTPTCFTDVPKGSVTLLVKNSGKSLHNVAVAAQHVNVNIARGTTAAVHIRVGKDPVVYVCTYHRDLGMVGVLVPAQGT